MLKIEIDLETNKDESIKVVANQLISNAKNDPLVAEALNKKNKSLVGMWKYINDVAKKRAKNGSVAIRAEEVFGLAQHYYDEDSIDFEPKEKASKKKEVAKAIELPEENTDVFDF